MSDPITITIDENGQSVNGTTHIRALGTFTKRLTLLNQSLEAYAIIPVHNFKQAERQHCQRVLESVRSEISGIDDLTHLPKVVQESLSRQQRDELDEAMVDLKESYADSVVLIMKLKVLMGEL